MMIDGVPHMQANAPDGPSADGFLPDAAARAAGADPNDVLYHECLAAHPDAHARLIWDTRLPAAGQTLYNLTPVLHYRSSGTWIRLPM